MPEIEHGDKKAIDKAISEKIKWLANKNSDGDLNETRRQVLIEGIRRICDKHFLEPYPGARIELEGEKIGAQKLKYEIKTFSPKPE